MFDVVKEETLTRKAGKGREMRKIPVHCIVIVINIDLNSKGKREILKFIKLKLKFKSLNLKLKRLRSFFFGTLWEKGEDSHSSQSA